MSRLRRNLRDHEWRVNRARCRLSIFDQYGLGVDRRQPLIHSGKQTGVLSCEQRKVSAGDLPMPDDPFCWYVEIRSIVWPEFVPGQGGNGFQKEFCEFRRRIHAGPEVEADEGALM